MNGDMVCVVVVVVMLSFVSECGHFLRFVRLSADLFSTLFSLLLLLLFFGLVCWSCDAWHGWPCSDTDERNRTYGKGELGPV